MHDVHLELLQQGISLHKEKKFDEAALIYNRLLNRHPFQEDLLYLLSDLYLRKDFNGLAINLLAALLQNNPKHAAAWCNLGAAFRKENEYDKAKAAWMRAIELGETIEVCNNLATLYADRSEPYRALEWIERGLRIGDNAPGRWQKSLALLSLKRWGEGWRHYEARRELDVWDGRPQIEAPIWDGSKIGRLYIHGEQGVGDEIMFASAIPRALQLADEVTIEVNPKVAGIVKQTWPHVRVVKEALPDRYDAKVPIGSLIGMFGMNPKPYLSPHPEKVKHYRRELERLGPGPYVALTWFGGTRETRCEDRSMALESLTPFMQAFTCVSAQYSSHNQYIEKERISQGLAKINEESAGEDLHDQAALFRAVDLVVTVQQTAVHVAGAVGAKTHAIIGSRPHWRYGVEGDELPFYSSVRLHRRRTDWAEVIERALNAAHRDIQRTEPATA